GGRLVAGERQPARRRPPRQLGLRPGPRAGRACRAALLAPASPAAAPPCTVGGDVGPAGAAGRAVAAGPGGGGVEAGPAPVGCGGRRSRAPRRRPLGRRARWAATWARLAQRAEQ